MRFRCARCGQRYSTSDEPRRGDTYRLQCLACGGTVTLKGADFPALPTLSPEPRAAAGGGAISEAAAEEPLGLALAPLAVRQAPAPPRRSSSHTASRPTAPPSRRIRVAATGAAALVAAGAGFLLVLPRSASEDHPAAARPGVAATAVPVNAPSPDAAQAVAPPAPASLAPRGVPPPEGAARKPPPAPPPPVTAGLRTSPAPPPAAHAPSPPGRRPAAAVAAAAPAGQSAPRTARSADQVILDAVAARRPALEACAQEWGREEPGRWVAGRRIDVLVTVEPGGTVTSSTVDDPEIDSTTLGACLRKVVSGPFPPFEGGPVQVQIPLRLGE